MKKSLLALAALTAFAGAASAQSSVTLFGIVDAAYGHMSAGGKSASGMTNSGLNSSRLGFRGTEDLGGGMTAGFWLEGGVGNDNGTTGGSNQSGTLAFFNRRSTVSLMGGFGEIRLGRDYTATFWNTTVYDPFGTNGVGQSMTPGMLGSASNTTVVRADNAISYFLPAMGGLSGQVQIGFGEQLSNAPNKDQGDYFGFRFGYAGGPLSAHFAYGKVKGATSAADVKTTNLGASYAIGAFTPMVFWGTEKSGAGAKVTGWELGGTFNMGQGQLRAAYSDYDTANSANDWTKWAFGYGYNLSKRTQMYATYARVSNKGAQTKNVANNGLSAGAAAAGGNASGYEFGVRHAF